MTQRDGTWKDNLRNCGLLLEFTPDEWAEYARKHFADGNGAASAFGAPRADPKDLRWRDPHRIGRELIEYPNEADDYDL